MGGNNDNMNNLWELYGLRENPFSTAPLLVKGGTLPIQSFVGRDEQLGRLTKLFSSAGGSRILVYGDVGVGKTTIVNVARYRALNQGFFTPFKEIAVQEHWNVDLFILNSLASIHSTIKLLQQKPISDKTIRKIESLLEVGVEEIDAGLNFGGVGGNYGKHIRDPIKVSTTTLIDLFAEVINEILENTKKDIIIHYNNLELLPERSIRRIFDNLRDFFQTPHIHFVFVGNLTVPGVFQTIPRFSSILSDTVLIENLSFDEIKKVIQIRLKHMRISEDLNYIAPCREDALKTLYDLFQGNIRNILNSLSTAITEVTSEKPMTLDENMLSRTLKQVVERRYLVGLQPRAKTVLLEAVKHSEITNRHLSRQTNIARSNVSTYLKQLQDKGCIYLRRKDGKDKFWSVDPKIQWWTLKAKAPKDPQQRQVTSFV